MIHTNEKSRIKCFCSLLCFCYKLSWEKKNTKKFNEPFYWVKKIIVFTWILFRVDNWIRLWYTQNNEQNKTWHLFAMDLLHLFSHFKLNQWKWWQIYDRSDESTHQTNEINDFSKRFKTKAKHRAHREPNYNSNESISIRDKKQI